MRKSVLNSFRKNPDDSWTSIEEVSILDHNGNEIKISEGINFSRGSLLMGIDWARWLDKQN